MKGMRGFLLSSALVFGSAHAILAAEKPKLPDGEGKAATVRLCGSCHAAAIVMSRRESREGWSGVVEDMIQRGAKGSDDEFGEVVDYLVAHGADKSRFTVAGYGFDKPIDGLSPSAGANRRVEVVVAK